MHEGGGHVALNTESGNTDLAWLSSDLLAITTDRGQLQLVRVHGEQRCMCEPYVPTLLTTTAQGACAE